MRICEGCHGDGGNWDCMGENDPNVCTCSNCSGSDSCYECEGTGYYEGGQS